MLHDVGMLGIRAAESQNSMITRSAIYRLNRNKTMRKMCVTHKRSPQTKRYNKRRTSLPPGELYFYYSRNHTRTYLYKQS